MSTNNITALFTEAKNNPVLRRKIESLDHDSALSGLVSLSRQFGLPFSRQDLLDYAQQSAELTDDELVSVSGGFGPEGAIHAAYRQLRERALGKDS